MKENRRGRPEVENKQKSRNIRTTDAFWDKIGDIIKSIGKWKGHSEYIKEAVSEKNKKELRKFAKNG